MDVKMLKVFSVVRTVDYIMRSIIVMPFRNHLVSKCL